MAITAEHPLQIRPATVADLTKLAALEAELFADVVYPAFFFRQAHDLWPDLLRLACRGDELLGYILAAPAQQGPGEMGILSLAVAQAAQGQGIGKMLLTDLLQVLPADGKKLWLTVAPDNKAAVALYQKFGFQSVKTEADYYGKGEHRMVLVKQHGG
ncbi:MAG TPA: N-acetyltransferase [Rheinheimera sp.]|uniref:GNAT family N-acetyltransferase n=1 Tax=Rheinheimera sp. TaxID=1869214 RepID=UPI000EBD17A0|nr:N-acetyltransferase [Rheinheimera sp.]HCU65451.1 N-acetyltransferase [Rheinheimera sp.]